MSLTITKNGVTLINAKAGTVKITQELDHRGFSISFTTEDTLEEWDEIEVEDGGSNLLFAGIIEKVSIRSTGTLIERQVSSSGYKRLFDRKKIAERYEDMTAGAIVSDIISDWTEDFTEGVIEDGSTFDNVPFNYVSPSDAISQLAKKIGFAWWIDNERAVHFKSRSTDTAPEMITDTSENFRDLKLVPEVSQLANSVIVRGGTFLSSDQTFEDVGNGTKTIFSLPEKPRSASVKVNTVSKTLGVKIEGQTPTTDFLVNYQEKYIENGTHAVLSDTDTLEVTYKYDVPLRIRKRDVTSIAAMAAIFPTTDGIFEKLIEDETIDSRDLAAELADEHLNLFSNTTINGSFRTYVSGFEPGQVLRIDAKGITNSAVIEKVVSKSLANGFFEYEISFATVLFDFEDFLRELLVRGSLELNDGETVELIYNVNENITLSDVVSVTIDENRQTETLEMNDSNYQAANFGVSYVYGEYFPSSHTDTKRSGVFDLSQYG